MEKILIIDTCSHCFYFGILKKRCLHPDGQMKIEEPFPIHADCPLDSVDTEEDRINRAIDREYEMTATEEE